MTGTEFAAAGQALALAYARLQRGGAEWLAAWQADDVAAADELMEWELEGHQFTGLPLAAPPHLEDGANAEPSLGAPEGHDIDREAA